MPPIMHKRQNCAMHAAFLTRHGSRETDSCLRKAGCYFTLQNWLLDFGRPLAMIFCPLGWFPLNKPSAGDYFHMLYNITTPFLLLKMFLQCFVFFEELEMHLCLKEKENCSQISVEGKLNISQTLKYVPLFLILLLYFTGCFTIVKAEKTMPISAWLLLGLSGLYYWYLVTEGHIFIPFIFTFFAMTATLVHQKRKGFLPDSNGLFLLYSVSLSLVLVTIWVACLWNDKVLRRKYTTAMGRLHTAPQRQTHDAHGLNL